MTTKYTRRWSDVDWGYVFLVVLLVLSAGGLAWQVGSILGSMLAMLGVI